MTNNKKRFDKLVRDIRTIKIQGARNVAKSALEAYFLIPNKKSIKELLNSRPTEPMMENVLDMAEKGNDKKEILEHFKLAQDKINSNVFKIIKNKDVIFTHCHSTNVVNSLIYSKKQGKKFSVVNTETRPLYQGRKTALELKNAGIKVTQYIDSAAMVAITNGEGNVQVDKVFLGADAILKQGVINKIGSGMFSRIAYDNKIPVYIIADSWKFTNKKVSIENRSLNEVWDSSPEHIKIKNPAFEFIDRKYITGIVSEYGILSYSQFLKKIR